MKKSNEFYSMSAFDAAVDFLIPEIKKMNTASIGGLVQRPEQIKMIAHKYFLLDQSSLSLKEVEAFNVVRSVGNILKEVGHFQYGSKEFNVDSEAIVTKKYNSHMEFEKIPFVKKILAGNLNIYFSGIEYKNDYFDLTVYDQNELVVLNRSLIAFNNRQGVIDEIKYALSNNSCLTDDRGIDYYDMMYCIESINEIFKKYGA